MEKVEKGFGAALKCLKLELVLAVNEQTGARSRQHVVADSLGNHEYAIIDICSTIVVITLAYFQKIHGMVSRGA